jgi:hypothetical protein
MSSVKKVVSDSKERKNTPNRNELLRKRVATYRQLAAKSNLPNGFMSDLFDAVLDGTEEFGDMIRPGAGKIASTVKRYRDKFAGLRKPQSANTKSQNVVRSSPQALAKKENIVIGSQGTPNRRRGTRLIRKQGVDHCIGTELITILPSTGFSQGTVIYQLPINPATMPCPRLRRNVRGYENGKIVSMKIHLDSAAGSNTPGQVAILVDRDPKDKWASGGQDVIRNAISHETCRLHSLFQSSSVSVTNKSMLWIDSDSDPDAVRFDTFGTFIIVCTQTIPSTAPVGTLFLSYDIELTQPAEQDSLTVGGSQAFFRSGPGSDEQWFNNDASFSTFSSLPCSIKGDVKTSRTLHCDSAGSFLIQFYLSGNGANFVSLAPDWGLNGHMSFSEGVSQYGGEYTSASPANLGPVVISGHEGDWCFGTATGYLKMVTGSTMIYSDSAWDVNLCQGIHCDASNPFSQLHVVIVALDSLPFASNLALRKASILESQTKALTDSVKRLDSLRVVRNVPSTMSASSSTSSSSTSSLNSTSSQTMNSLSSDPIQRETSSDYVHVTYNIPGSGTEHTTMKRKDVSKLASALSNSNSSSRGGPTS